MSAPEELIRTYGESYDALRLGTAEFVEQLWLDLGGPDDRRLNEFADAAGQVVDDANRATAALVDEYVDAYVGTISRTPPASANAGGLAEYAADQLRDSVADLWRRPGITARKALADGKPFEEAMQLGGTRAGSMAEADVALAHRAAARDAMERNGLDGYRRVLTGVSCDLCRVASTQLYRTGDLMPIHSRCDCRIAPVVDGYDGGRIVNRELYRELKADGTLDRLNRRNAGTTGRSRAAGAQARRQAAQARQLRLDGADALPLDLRQPSTALELAGRPPASPTVRLHGELGPVLVNERHAFTAARRQVDEVLDASDLRRQGPEVVEEAAEELVDAKVPDPPAAVERVPRSGQFSKDTPSVVRAAIRRNVDPEDIIDELELKRLDRLEAQKLERDYLRQLDDPTSDAVREAADGWGVSPDEFVAARAQVKNTRRVVADAATKAQLDAFSNLDKWDAVRLPFPPDVGAVNEFGVDLRGGSWDWLETLDDREIKRLRRDVFDKDVNITLDDIVESVRAAEGGDLSIDEAAKRILRENRRMEAAGAIRRGKPPSSRAYSGAVDVDAIAGPYMPNELRLLPSEVVGRSDVDVAGRIAQLAREADVEDALAYLDRSVDAVHGPPPWRMSFQAFEAELRDIEYGLRNYPSELDATAIDRLGELVPDMLDDPGTSYEELYSRIISTARRGGQDVADYARIPWHDAVDDGLPDIDDLFRGQI